MGHFCDVCCQVWHQNSEPSLPTGGKPHHSSIASLRESADTGCLICIRLAAKGDGIDAVSTSYRIDYQFITFSVVFESGNSGKRHEDACWYKVIPDQGCSQVLLPALDMAASLQICSDWLATCTLKHVHHHLRPLISGWKPPRLVDAGSNAMLPKLVEAGDAVFASVRNYLTLSYCRGGDDFVHLTQDSLADYKDSIPMDTLPRTFQDAILLTKSLPVQFIWIDALCIVQDSPDNHDWIEHCSIMGEIYSNSISNVAAADSASPHEGLFRSRGLSDVVVVPLGDQGHKCAVPTRNPQSPTTHSPLVTRSWALQEELLPLRTIRFSSSQMFWDCDLLHACEHFPTSLTDLNMARLKYARQDARFRGLRMAFRMAREAEANRGWFFTSWAWLVAQFSKRQLARSDDRAMAIQGIAKLLERVSRGDLKYLAGVWGESATQGPQSTPCHPSLLLATLAWYISAPRAKPANDRAPSWSWISTDGEVVFVFEDLASATWNASVSRLVGVNTASNGGTGFGGELTIEGHLVSTKGIKQELGQAGLRGLCVSWDYSEARATQDDTFLLGLTLDGGPTGSVIGLVLCQVDGLRFRRCGAFSLAVAAAGHKRFAGQPSGSMTITII